MCPEDGDLLTAKLRAKFPRLRFVPFDYQRVWDGGERRLRRPDELALDYLDACHHRDHLLIVGWVEPEGWSPLWVDPSETGVYRILNEPEEKAVFSCAHLPPSCPQSYQVGEQSIWELEQDSPARRRFFGQVRRVVMSFCTDWLLHIDPETGEPMAGLRNFSLWMGPHAAEWCRQHPLRNYMRLRPPPPGSPPDPRKTTGKPLRP